MVSESLNSGVLRGAVPGPEAVFRHSAYHADFARRVGIFHLLGAMQPMGEAGVMLVGSHRPERRGRFEEAKRRVLERMLPNRRRAVQLRHPSPAETDVALAAIGGATPKTIAAGRGSSVNTVRRQIRTVFARTHSASLRDMTRLVATTMP